MKYNLQLANNLIPSFVNKIVTKYILPFGAIAFFFKSCIMNQIVLDYKLTKLMS